MADGGGEQRSTDGFHLIVDALRANGVKTIYGVVGIPVTDVARIAQASGIRYIGFRHEQAAGHAAAAAGFLTQRPGICLTTSAPGFLNGMTALANATVNCFPMILVSGSSDRAIVDLGQGDYEELDQLAAARPYAKAAFRVNEPESIGIAVARALRVALAGRPGGVYLDLPSRVLHAQIDAQRGAASVRVVSDPAPAQLPAAAAVAAALDVLATAQRPLIILGKGAAYSRAEAPIRAFVETTGMPYLPMSMAKGLLPDDHPQSAAAARSLALGSADVVMLIGARLNWLLEHGKPPRFAADCRFVQVDVCAEEIDSNVPITAAVIGDLASAMTCLLDAARARSISADGPRAPWLARIQAKAAENTAKMTARLAAVHVPMDFHGALGAIRTVLADRPDVVIANEGANTLDLGRDILPMVRPRQRLDCGTWGAMGVGLGFAIGAAVETGGPVVAVEGDSAFGFSGMEVETMCRYGLPIVVIVFNNGGVYRGCETNARSSDPAVTVLTRGSRYDKVIEAFGGAGYHVEGPAALAAALRTALQSGKPALINCVIDPEAGTESGHLTNLN